MTFNNDRSQKSSMSHANQPSKFDGSGDDTPRRIPVPPQHPTQEHQQSSAATQQAIWTAPTAPPATAQQLHITAPSSSLARPAPLMQPPPFVAAAFPAPKRRRRVAIPVMIILVLLAVLIGLGGYVGRQLVTGTVGGQTPATQATTHAGPFVQPPLTAMELNSLQHLVGYMKYKQLAAMYVARMSLDVELGQLIMVEYSDTYYSPDLDMMINQLHAGGVIMYEFQMQTFNQTKHDIAEMQQHATFPLLISTDEEGGPYVHRLKNIYGLRMSATDIYNTGDPNVATQQGHKVAHDLLSLGINENLAPDVDVNLVNGYDMVTRTFGNDPNSVITYAGAYMRALQSDGVVACIKHFPGLGDAVTDAHTSLPVVNRTKAQIYATELAPYKYFIQSQNPLDNPGMIMPTDVLMPAIDPVMPAELSHTFMTDILRKQLGFDGVALTDALYMQGISDKWTMPQAAVLALNAGNDMLLGPNGAGEMIAMLNGIKQALQDGTLSKARVDEAVTRIIALKMSDHLMPAIPPQA